MFRAFLKKQFFFSLKKKSDFPLQFIPSTLRTKSFPLSFSSLITPSRGRKHEGLGSLVLCACVYMSTHIQVGHKGVGYMLCGGQRLMLGCLPQSFLYLTFWDKLYHWTRSSWFPLERLAIGSPGCSWFCVPSAGVTGVCHAWLLHGHWVGGLTSGPDASTFFTH